MDALSETPAHDPETGEVIEPAVASADPDDDGSDDELYIADLPDLKMDTLRGDLRDAMLTRLRAMPKPFTVMSQREQQDLIYGIDKAASHLISQALRLIIANGQKSLRCSVDNISLKDGAKIVLKASKHDEDLRPFIHEMIEKTGAVFMLTIMNPNEYDGERTPARAEPDQKNLPLQSASDQPSNVSAFKAKDKPEDEGGGPKPDPEDGDNDGTEDGDDQD